jgi:hypothetical protein
MNAEKIKAGIAIAVKSGVDRGWDVDLCYLRPEVPAGPVVERQLASASRLSSSEAASACRPLS